MSFILDIPGAGLAAKPGRGDRKRRKGARRMAHFRSTKGLLLKRTLLWSPSDVNGEHLLTDVTGWAEPAWGMNQKIVPRLAETIRVLGERLPQAFFFRTTLASDPIPDERDLTAGELAELVLASQMNEYTPYRVLPREPSRR